MSELKNRFIYFLFFTCLIGVCSISFNSTFKLLKQSISVTLTETDFDDLEEEDETEKKEIEEDAKLITEKSNLDFLYNQQIQFYLNHIEASSVSMFKYIQSPPPKI